MMRRVTVTIPDELDAELDRFLASQPVKPPISSVVRTALERYLVAGRPTTQGPLLPKVLANREEIRKLASRRRAGSIRVFGSVARGEDGPGSDIDFLVTPQPGFSLFDRGGLMAELSELLGVEVDVVTDRTVPSELMRSIEAEAITL